MRGARSSTWQFLTRASTASATGATWRAAISATGQRARARVTTKRALKPCLPFTARSAYTPGTLGFPILAVVNVIVNRPGPIMSHRTPLRGGSPTVSCRPRLTRSAWCSPCTRMM